MAAFLGAAGMNVFVFVFLGEVKTNLVFARILALRATGIATGSLMIRAMRCDGARLESKIGALTGKTFAYEVADVISGAGT